MRLGIGREARILLAVGAALVVAAGCGSSRPEWMQDGMPAPVLAGATTDGGHVDLAAEHGKTAVVVFFEDGCGQCRALYATERELAARMKGIAFTMIGVDGKDSPAALRDAVQRERLPFPVVHDGDAAIAKAWGVTAVPWIYVIDAAGVVRGCNPSKSSLFATVDALTGRLRAQ